MYGVFLKRDKPIEEIVTGVANLTKDTAFPSQGVEGFLKENIDKMTDELFTVMEGGSTKYEIDKNSILVTYISERTASLANVFFTADIVTPENGTVNYSFFIPVKFDWKVRGYVPAGKVAITNYKTENKVKEEKNELLEFNQDLKEEDEVNKSSRTFVDNFLKSLYNSDIDISQMYIGSDPIIKPEAEYQSITKYQQFKENNKLGYNAVVEFTMVTKNKVRFTNTSYLKIQKQGNTWVIKSIL